MNRQYQEHLRKGCSRLLMSSLTLLSMAIGTALGTWITVQSIYQTLITKLWGTASSVAALLSSLWKRLRAFRRGGR